MLIFPMNARQLEKLGIPRSLASIAVAAIQRLIESGNIDRKHVKRHIRQVAESPALFVGDPLLDTLARELQQLQDSAGSHDADKGVPLAYVTWGTNIDQSAHEQMRQACRLPNAVGAALMPDAHVGYGLPIGGVLAVKEAVIPYAVGVDIACRMKLSILDVPVEHLERQFDRFRNALMNGTVFGVGVGRPKPADHSVMDQDWSITRVTRQNRDKARHQLGTSGSGNHFVEFGVLTVTEPVAELGLSAGQYTSLLSHSGSRGPGAAVCSTYSSIARVRLPRKYQFADRLAWLDLTSEPGQEYWAAMNLMGDYAAANHAVIHRSVSQLLGSRVIAAVENHHNFAWLEQHGSHSVVVHRKGATPAAAGVLGIIPGSMASPAFVVRGKGNPQSWNSAAHGAGRVMSRKKAHDQFNFRSVQKSLAARGVHVLSAGADEVPMVYKNIEQVMAEQADLVEPIARFDPRIVRMCGDGSRAED